MTEKKTPTEEFIAQLNGTEEVLEALDQMAGDIYPIARACRKAYLAIEKLRDEEHEGWNGDLDTPDSDKVYRCKFAAVHYHTDADGICEVWSSKEVCGLHEQLEIEKAEREAERAEYHRAKRRGEDV